jgi:hypothetical protein
MGIHISEQMKYKASVFLICCPDRAWVFCVLMSMSIRPVCLGSTVLVGQKRGSNQASHHVTQPLLGHNGKQPAAWSAPHWPETMRDPNKSNFPEREKHPLWH